jgi:hypothetical protein
VLVEGVAIARGKGGLPAGEGVLLVREEDGEIGGDHRAQLQ